MTDRLALKEEFETCCVKCDKSLCRIQITNSVRSNQPLKSDEIITLNVRSKTPLKH